MWDMTYLSDKCVNAVQVMMTMTIQKNRDTATSGPVNEIAAHSTITVS